MALILLLETSTEICSVSLSSQGVVLHTEEAAVPNSHASHLTLLIRHCMAECGHSFSQLDAIAISRGPGSYTSLRIGGATAKGLCYGTGTPLIAIDSLAALATGVSRDELEQEDRLVAMIDARRMEVYAATYDSLHQPLDAVRSVVLESTSFTEGMTVSAVLHICGNGAAKFIDIAAWQNIRRHHTSASSRNMVSLAEAAYAGGHFEDVFAYSPFYLKDPHITISKNKFP